MAVSECKTKIGQTKTYLKNKQNQNILAPQYGSTSQLMFGELLGWRTWKVILMIVSWVTITMWCYSETAPEFFGLIVQKGAKQTNLHPLKINIRNRKMKVWFRIWGIDLVDCFRWFSFEKMVVLRLHVNFAGCTYTNHSTFLGWGSSHSFLGGCVILVPIGWKSCPLGWKSSHLNKYN